jgi:hypothetical protein
MISKEQKDKWITALRSGEYKQTKNRLFSGKGYCCLGVFCKAVEGINLCRGEIDDMEENQVHYERLEILFPTDTLIIMNDKGCKFPEIADYIEANIPAE